VDLPPHPSNLAEELLLDGQQRLTSLTQVLKLDKPVATRDAKKRELQLHYYFDIEKALQGPDALADALKAVDEQRTQREDFGRKVVLNLSTRRCFPLSVFELDTAAWAADGFNLRDDWFGPLGKGGRHSYLIKRVLLRDLQSTNFLQGVSLLYSLERRTEDRSGKEVAGVTAKREHILEMPLSAFQKWSEPLTKGFKQVERFLRSEGFHHPKFLSYRTQLTPLAVVLTHLGERWLEQASIRTASTHSAHERVPRTVGSMCCSSVKAPVTSFGRRA